MLKSNGGYKIIDLKSPTVYEDIESCIDKPILFTNIIIDNIEKNPIFANVLVDNGNYNFIAYDKKFIINSNNEINIIDSELHLYQHLMSIQLLNDEKNEGNGGYLFFSLYKNYPNKITSNEVLKNYSSQINYAFTSCTGSVLIDTFTIPIGFNYYSVGDYSIRVSINGNDSSKIERLYTTRRITDNVIKIF